MLYYTVGSATGLQYQDHSKFHRGARRPKPRFLSCHSSAFPCFDNVGWAAGRASWLLKLEWWGTGMLSVWSEMQTCIWPSWCHCHSLSLASVKSRLTLPFWYRLTRVVPEKGPLNECVCMLYYTVGSATGLQDHDHRFQDQHCSKLSSRCLETKTKISFLSLQRQQARHKEAETNLGHAVDASPVHLSTSVLELGENFVFDVCRQRLEILWLSVVPV